MIELAKVSRLLIAVEEGKAAQFSGCSLDDINISGKDNLNNLYQLEKLLPFVVALAVFTTGRVTVCVLTFIESKLHLFAKSNFSFI